MTEPAGVITVLAGTNGAGKSSIAGAWLSGASTSFYNPDAETRALRAAHPNLSEPDANSAAWHTGVQLLQQAIEHSRSFNFETTLGGSTIVELLRRAHQRGLRVRMWYCGLASPELHIERVRARVRRGGHDIPEARIRARYDSSREHLCALLPCLDELLLYDNSIEADPHAGQRPAPQKLLHLRAGRILHLQPHMPSWAKPIAAVALECAARSSAHAVKQENSSH